MMRKINGCATPLEQDGKYGRAIDRMRGFKEYPGPLPSDD